MFQILPPHRVTTDHLNEEEVEEHSNRNGDAYLNHTTCKIKFKLPSRHLRRTKMERRNVRLGGKADLWHEHF